MDAEPLTPHDPAVRLEDAVTVIGRFPALAGATVRVDTGEIVLLQGPTGPAGPVSSGSALGSCRSSGDPGTCSGWTSLPSDMRSVLGSVCSVIAMGYTAI